MPVRLCLVEQYPTWFARQAIAYAEDKVRAKQWGPDGAEERARQETEPPHEWHRNARASSAQHS